MTRSIDLRFFAAALLSTYLLVACSEQQPPNPTPSDKLDITSGAAQSESVRLNAWFQQLFEEDLERSPQWQTYRGLKTNYDKWDDNSDKAILDWYARAEDRLEHLKAFDFDKLEAPEKLSWRIFKLNQENAIADEKFRFHDYLISQSGGSHTRYTQMLANAHTISSLSEAEAYVTRVKTIQTPLGNYTAQVKQQGDMGIMAPRFAFPLMLGTIDNMLMGQPFQKDAKTASTLLADFRTKIGNLEIADEVKVRLEGELVAGLLEAYGPSLVALRKVLADMENSATDDDGVWKLPEGEAYYNFALSQMTTTDLTFDEIHSLGLTEVVRIHGEMERLIAKMGFKGSLQDYFEYARTDAHFYYPDTDEGRERYVAEAQAAQDKAYEKVPDFFKFPLKDRIEVRPVEKYRENGSPLAFYSRPAQDGSRPGIYYVNTKNMKSLPTYQMEAIAFHEGIPGHHYQSSVIQNLTGIPEFRKNSYFTAYSEGWGLYAERLAHEMGVYRDDESEFGRLVLELWRAMRLVADTGLHAKKWTRQQTINYMVTNSPMDVVNITTEVQRYVTNAGQATAYKIGMIKLLELRAKARETLGDNFDIKAFHDVILAEGPVPLAILEENVDQWIVATNGEADDTTQ